MNDQRSASGPRKGSRQASASRHGAQEGGGAGEQAGRDQDGQRDLVRTETSILLRESASARVGRWTDLGWVPDPRHDRIRPAMLQDGPDEGLDPTTGVTYDDEVDAAYIYFTPDVPPGGVSRTVPVDGGDDPWMVNLDVDVDGRIIGLEVLDAAKRLPAALLANRP